jgi:WD40 repeat protein
VIERTGTVESVLLSPNGQALSVAGGSQVDIWDLSTLTVSAAQLKVFREPHGAYAMGFSPDSQHFIASRELKPVNEYCLQLWDLRGKPIARSKSHAYPFLDIAFSDDGRVIASGSYNQITLWNLDNDEHARLIGTYPSGERHLGARGNLGH